MAATRSFFLWIEAFFVLFVQLCVKSEDVDVHKLLYSNGGWYTDTENLIAQPGPCNIDVRDESLTQRDFLQKYAEKAPVIFRSVTDNSNFRKLCSKSSLVENYGSKEVILSSANTYSYTKVPVSFQHYVEEILRPQDANTLGNETLYLFGDQNYTEWEPLLDHYVQPPYYLPGHTGALSFGLAGAGTGVPFHFHGPGFGEVIYGRKRWFLYPPDQQPAFNPNRTTLQWVMEKYPQLEESEKPYECTIGPGEIIYFPDRWWHGTLNIDTSVFISTFLAMTPWA
ncbi:jmjC domain-containing protein 8-like [Branchiostoma floridae]|uniref:JmjC domain-containing protein 8-like n=1 Tax=Branchiostoma floridae TaxID=7739 RepID=A0A9J7M8S4_BRAFL|nr:jmjC domain-containing protein 8-like [Branchiostoma floridae]